MDDETTLRPSSVSTLLMVALLAVIGCSDDVTNTGDCPGDQTYDPIEEVCVDDSRPGTDTSDGGETGGDDTDASDDCEGPDCNDVSCGPTDPRTSISGTVHIPSGQLPLPDVDVYVPHEDSVDELPRGATCRQCEDRLSGDPMIHDTTGRDGFFRLADIPVVDELDVVVEIGKWRRKITVDDITPCQDNLLDEDRTRLPRDSQEGDLPRIAMTTGGCDAMECLMRKIGISDDEFSTDDNDGHVHLFAGDGGTDRFEDGPPLPDAYDWWNDVDNLVDYDIVVHSCECSPHRDDKSSQARQALLEFTEAGGRAFLSHWHNTWLEDGPDDFRSVATWDPLSPEELLGTATGHIDDSFPKGERFREWMYETGTTPAGQFTISQPRGTIDELDTDVAQQWIYLDPTEAPSDTDDRPQYFSFNTPVGADEDDQCGRTVFSDIHVAADDDSSPDTPFPTGCTSQQLNAQEKALVYMLFDISRCIVDDDKKAAPQR